VKDAHIYQCTRRVRKNSLLGVTFIEWLVLSPNCRDKIIKTLRGLHVNGGLSLSV
jgi:hypothetical protein